MGREGKGREGKGREGMGGKGKGWEGRKKGVQGREREGTLVMSKSSFNF